MDELNNTVTDSEMDDFSIQEFEFDFCAMLDDNNDDIGRT